MLKSNSKASLIKSTSFPESSGRARELQPVLLWACEGTSCALGRTALKNIETQRHYQKERRHEQNKEKSKIQIYLYTIYNLQIQLKHLPFGWDTLYTKSLHVCFCLIASNNQIISTQLRYMVNKKGN